MDTVLHIRRLEGLCTAGRLDACSLHVLLRVTVWTATEMFSGRQWVKFRPRSQGADSSKEIIWTVSCNWWEFDGIASGTGILCRSLNVLKLASLSRVEVTLSVDAPWRTVTFRRFIIKARGQTGQFVHGSFFLLQSTLPAQEALARSFLPP